MLNITMKSNPVIVLKQDSHRKRNRQVQLKRKLGALPTDSAHDYLLYKLQNKPRSTSKSADKSVNLNFSRSYLAPHSTNHRSSSGDRMKPLTGKIKPGKSGNTPIPLLKIEKASPHQTSKYTHYHSADRELRKTKSTSKNKSYLFDYLNQKNHPHKAQSLGKLEISKKEDKSRVKTQKTEQKEVQKEPFAVKIRTGQRTRQGVLISNPSKPNQDRYVVDKLQNGTHLFAVADGHGVQGHLVSQLAARRLADFAKTHSTQHKSYEILFSQMYQKIQQQLFAVKDFNANTSGSTLITILLEQNGLLTCANVGDSRAILARQIDKKNWEIIHLSEDHKPSNQKQKKRILKKGGKVYCFKDEHGHSVGPQRVWLPNQNIQGLAMSRSIGDNVSKGIGVTHEPELIQLQLQKRDKFILVASDGVWEFIQNYEILQLVVPYFKDGKIEECCDALLQLAYDRWTVEDTTVVDDITFVLIFLNQ